MADKFVVNILLTLPSAILKTCLEKPVSASVYVARNPIPRNTPNTGVAETAEHTIANPKFAWLAGSNDSPDKLSDAPANTPNVDIPKYLLFGPVKVNSVLSPFNEPPDGVDKKVNAEE